ncbi:MAG: hypothetical protein UHN41_05945 [Bacteroidales bacterium]|nr:hypothetical protein [Bacteroidales bacterium]
MKRCGILFLLIASMFLSLESIGQEIQTKSDKKQYNIGDVIELTFSVPIQKGQHVDLIYNKENSDTLELQSTKIDTVQNNGKTFLACKQTYMGFIPGVIALGDSVLVRYSVYTNETILRLQPAEIEILQYQIDTLKTEIKDIKPLVEEPFSIKEILPLIYLILGIVALIVGLYFLVRYLRNRPKENKPQIVQKKQIPPHIKALKSLEDLRLKRLSEQGLKKQYYSELSEIVWIYLEERFSITACEMTTEEILEQMKRCSEISVSDFENLKKMFDISDLVKFAKYESDDFADKNAWSVSKDFVNNTTVEPNIQTEE